jgi:hypothetical protein
MAEAPSLRDKIADCARLESSRPVRELRGYMECIKHHGIPQDRHDLEDAEEILKEWFPEDEL